MWNKKKILIVDDEIEIRDSLELVLSRAGYDVVTAQSGEAAYNYLSSANVGMMLVDLSMPGLNGEELIGKLRTDRKLPPSIIISAYTPGRPENLSLYGVGYMRKPYDGRVLVRTIEKLIGKEKHSGN